MFSSMFSVVMKLLQLVRILLHEIIESRTLPLLLKYTRPP